MKQCMICLSLLVTALLLAGGMAQADDKNVGQLWYANCGYYAVSPLWLNWKVDGEKYSKRLDRSLTKAEYTCVDLASYNVPEGAEVWLSFQIVAGDKESCRKDDKRFFYKSGSQMVQFFLSEGTTLNDNRCKVNDYANPEGNDCESKGDAGKWWNKTSC